MRTARASTDSQSVARRGHGARSQGLVTAKAGYVKQALLQPLGLRQGDLDRVARAYLDLYARAKVKVELMDRWVDEHGWVDEEGNTPAFVATYFAALNSARHTLAKLETHLGQRVGDPLAVLELEGRRLRLAAEQRFAEGATK